MLCTVLLGNSGKTPLASLSCLQFRVSPTGPAKDSKINHVTVFMLIWLLTNHCGSDANCRQAKELSRPACAPASESHACNRGQVYKGAECLPRMQRALHELAAHASGSRRSESVPLSLYSIASCMWCCKHESLTTETELHASI